MPAGLETKKVETRLGVWVYLILIIATHLKKIILGIESLQTKITEIDPLHKTKLTKETFVFSVYAYRDYLQAGKEVKIKIVVELGSNREIFDKNVVITLYPWFQPLNDKVIGFNKNLARLEPQKYGYDYTKNEALNTLRLAWLGGLDSIPLPMGYTYSPVSRPAPVGRQAPNYSFGRARTISSPTS